MVDALRRAHRMAATDGFVIDVHPTDAPAVVDVGDLEVGPLDAGDASSRHAAASDALTAAVAARLFERIAVVEFDFHTYADTIDELRDFIAQTWKTTRIGEPTVEAARAALAAAESGVRPRTRERVQLTTLRPLALR
jgi:hypothetical protein